MRYGKERVSRMQAPVFEYVHCLDGRLRIKVPEVRRSPVHAERVEAMFRGRHGVRAVSANPMTGNVLFMHDPDQIAAREIMAALIAAGYMGMGAAGAAPGEGNGVVLIVAIIDGLIDLVVRALPGGTIEREVLSRLVEVVARWLGRITAKRLAPAPA